MRRRVAELAIEEDARSFRASMPAGRNPWFPVIAIVFGVPWLIGYAGLSAVIIAQTPAVGRGVLYVVMLTLLTILLDVVAVMSIWAAIYSRIGTETLAADRAEVRVRRSVLGVTIPFRAGRSLFEQVERVAGPVSARRGPQPRLEFRSSRTRLRFGAGLSDTEVPVLERALSDYLDRTRASLGTGNEGDGGTAATERA